MKRNELKIPFFLIWRFITRSNKWTLSLTIFLMAIAFINLVFITSLFNGIVDGSNNQIINALTGHVIVNPLTNQDYIGNASNVVATIRRTTNVVGASAQTQVSATLHYKTLHLSRPILAINPNDEKTVSDISTHMIEGKYLSANDTDGVMIGIQVAGGPDVELNSTSFKGAHVGETLELIMPTGTKTFTIRGIFNTKFVNADSRIFVSEAALKELAPTLTDKATSILVRINKTGREDATIAALKANGVQGTFDTWHDAAGLIKSVTKSFLSINVIISFVGILIAAITIFIVIYIDITNKKRQIGILRAIGIKPWIIRMAYVLQSAVYSFAGVLVGTALFFGIIVPYFQIHPFVLPICDAVLVINPTDYILRAEAIMLVALISGLIPAIFVTRMKILNAILGK